ncbi:MAG: hydrogenase formation protein HypD [Cyclobacteriaceae bacterium]|nr:hydrogenase formation protein HypD [Cyclobacteriaceae bacterium]
MKYLTEYRDATEVQRHLEQINKIVTRPWTIMETCGGQTHGLVKNGILEMLPKEITMVHGPGCPVCVTPLELIDKAVHLAQNKDVILCSFGDMLRVPGSKKSLLQIKAEGADVRILYSPLEALNIAKENPNKEVVFFAVGFETTAPANALSVYQAKKSGITNYSILVSHVLVPPAMEAILNDKDNRIQGFLAAGHVLTIMGFEEYYPIIKKYKVPVVVTGFEPLDLVQGILMVVRQLEKGEYKLENQYSRVVQEEGNKKALETIKKVFEVSHRAWRGIGEIPYSGYKLRDKYSDYDAETKFKMDIGKVNENEICIAGDVLKGIKKPYQCPAFGKQCTPENPLGAPMVSSEGACAAYYHYTTF